MEGNKIVKKSIFKQPIYRRLYDFYINSGTKFNQKTRKYEELLYPEILKTNEKIREDTIFICDLEMPMLDIGESFYIEKLDKIVEIKERMRTSEENVMYTVEPSVIKDEESLRTKQIAENLMYNYKFQSSEFENYKNKVNNSFWSRFIKGI